MKFRNALAFARSLDRNDPLRSYRALFYIPRYKRKTCLYFTGHSLGLQPRSAAKFIRQELNAWAQSGVEGHFHGPRPWLHYHKLTKKILASLTGAEPAEVVAMNQLSVNLHLMLTSFYRPTPARFKIIAEAGAFSSDQYALESQIRLHGLPRKALIELKPRAGEFTLRTDDIVTAIQHHGRELALVMLGAVQYYSGQFFDLSEITRAGHRAGAMVGFDLAHAIGNVPLHLHRDEVDFAVWCSYKYLNSGPGGVGGAFVHSRHHQTNLPRLAGWWGHVEKERFQMKKGFKPMTGADGWQVSNFPIISGAAQLAALEIFRRAGMNALVRKSLKLTGYLEFLLQGMASDLFEVITPARPTERGCQLSILVKSGGRKVFDKLTRSGVLADWREPNVIRVAPVPLYNSFEDVFRFVELFRNALLATKS